MPAMLTGLVMGGGIFIMDMVLRPNLGEGFAELARFLIEGTGCAMIYAYMENEDGLPYGDGNDWKQDKGIRLTLTSAITLYFTDMFLRPEIVRGIGSESMKFILQGIIVTNIVAYFAGLPSIRGA